MCGEPLDSYRWNANKEPTMKDTNAKQWALELITARLALAHEIEHGVAEGQAKIDVSMWRAWHDVAQEIDDAGAWELVGGELCDFIAAFCSRDADRLGRTPLALWQQIATAYATADDD
jgi:hypothetical protein